MVEIFVIEILKRFFFFLKYKYMYYSLFLTPSYMHYKTLVDHLWAIVIRLLNNNKRILVDTVRW